MCHFDWKVLDNRVRSGRLKAQIVREVGSLAGCLVVESTIRWMQLWRRSARGRPASRRESCSRKCAIGRSRSKTNWGGTLMNRHWNLSLALGICLCAMLAIGAQAWAHPGGLNTPSPDLPPIIVPGVYLSPSDVHAKYSGPALEIVLKDLKHQPFALLDPNEVRPDGSEDRKSV